MLQFFCDDVVFQTISKLIFHKAAVEPLDSLLEVKRRAGCDIGTEDRTEGHQDLQADKRERDEQLIHSK